METRTGVSGLISADRVFGLLERDFLNHNIEAAVAQALRPATKKLEELKWSKEKTHNTKSCLKI